VVAGVIRQPIQVGGRELRVGCSIGIATIGGPLSLPDLLGRADAALARSKSAGRPVLWHPRYDDDTGRRGGTRPAVRTRDLRPARYGNVHAPREGAR
jgi:GGDEF domain-containing protein